MKNDLRNLVLSLEEKTNQSKKKAFWLLLVNVLFLLFVSAFCSCKQGNGQSANSDSLKIAHSSNCYELHPTKNMWNFIRLNTSNGTMKMVQWALDDKEFIYDLNSTPLCKESKAGRFELYNTDNVYQFLLLDKITGDCWHVQWSFEEDKRSIQKIEEPSNI